LEEKLVWKDVDDGGREKGDNMWESAKYPSGVHEAQVSGPKWDPSMYFDMKQVP
jgi:hypothetical protein